MDFKKLLDQEPKVWNEWRDTNQDIWPDLSGIDLSNKDLSYRDFHYVDFSRANLIGSDLSYCNLSSTNLTSTQLQSSTINHTQAEWANFTDACLDNATLMGTNFEKTRFERASMKEVNAANSSFEAAILHMANLSGAYLADTQFLRTDMKRVTLNQAQLGLTLFVDTNLFGAIGLESCEHGSFSFVDNRTIAKSGEIDSDFLKGCGLPDALINHYPDLVKGTIRYKDCFISCSESDFELADHLYKNLWGNGVICYLYKHDMRWGARIWDSLDDAIAGTDKFILILSKDSIRSEWVEDEVTKAFAEERKRNEDILLPLMIDNTIMESQEPWASKIKNGRNVANFQNWRDPVEGQKLLRKLMELLLEPNPRYK